jgi:hypothetical protein
MTVLVQHKASPGRALRAVENLSGELTAGGINIVTARLAGRGHDSGSHQKLGETAESAALASGDTASPERG